MPHGQAFNGVIYHQHTPIKFTSKVVRLVEQEPVWYAVTINIAESAGQNHYLELIHDGDNTLLPKAQDNWITPLDELHMNVMMHMKNIERRLMGFMRQNT